MMAFPKRLTARIHPPRLPLPAGKTIVDIPRVTHQLWLAVL